VVLFCGGLGMRLRDYSENVPKPMVTVGYRPLLWNVMRYYAHYGHKDFVLCLGHKADVVKNYFLNYNEYLSNDFTMAKGGQDLRLAQSDIHDWTITFADTGLSSNIGERLLAARKYIRDEAVFLANYSDGLTDYPLPQLIDAFTRRDKIGCFLSVRPNHSFHIVSSREDGAVESIKGVGPSELYVNGGYFIFKQAVFDYLKPGEELVQEPFQRLIARNELTTCRYDGFWLSMETFKDKQQLDDMYARGETPWEVWKPSNPAADPTC
jgi:glucose-1-phosphate cytidylyltransferase